MKDPLKHKVFKRAESAVIFCLFCLQAVFEKLFQLNILRWSCYIVSYDFEHLLFPFFLFTSFYWCVWKSKMVCKLLFYLKQFSVRYYLPTLLRRLLLHILKIVKRVLIFCLVLSTCFQISLGIAHEYNECNEWMQCFTHISHILWVNTKCLKFRLYCRQSSFNLRTQECGLVWEVNALFHHFWI